MRQDAGRPGRHTADSPHSGPEAEGRRSGPPPRARPSRTSEVKRHGGQAAAGRHRARLSPARSGLRRGFHRPQHGHSGATAAALTTGNSTLTLE
ncbi:hypothetical protein SSAG_00032 [Streptomyces sp. Mg1]|nr:hypothetical protein SSAG_00032 [Streptomyces sp. Mg1]